MIEIKNWDHPITRSNLLRLLSSRRWIKLQHPNANITVYQSPMSSEQELLIKIVIPNNDEAFIDDSTRLINILSNYYEVNTAETKIDILNQSADISFDKIMDEDKGSISLELASSIISSLYENTKKAATIEKHKLLLNSNKLIKTPNILKHAQFGHTFQGSFGFALIIPLPESYQASITMESNAPYERLVLERIHNSYKIIESSIASNSIDPFMEDIENAPTPSMCDEYRKIFIKTANPKIEHLAKWSPLYLNAENTTETRTIITGEAAPLLALASKALKSESVPTKATIFGKVPDLHKDPFSQGDEKRIHYVTILWEPTPNKFIHVKVELDHEIYQKALRAHEKELIVAADGFLKKGAPFYQLFNPSNFRIL